MALLTEAPATGLSLDSGTCDRLAALGITRVSVLENEKHVVLLIEGWAFDPQSSAESAQQVLLDRPASQLLPAAEIAVTRRIPEAQTMEPQP